MKTVSIIGMGRLGQALSRELSDKFSLDLKIGRKASDLGVVALDSVQAIGSDVVFISTSDDSISEVARSLGGLCRDDAVILHTSGSLSSAVLAQLRSETRSIGSMHPLVSVRSDAMSGIFHGAYFCIEGDERAISTATDIAISLGGIPFSIPSENKPLYHAAAVTAAGHVTALIGIACELMLKAGVPADLASTALMPLVESVVRNIAAKGTAASLTGTYSRGDITTAQTHIDALEKHADPMTQELFIDLAIHSLAIARTNGLDESRASEVENVLRIAHDAVGE